MYNNLLILLGLSNVSPEEEKRIKLLLNQATTDAVNISGVDDVFALQSIIERMAV